MRFPSILRRWIEARSAEPRGVNTRSDRHTQGVSSKKTERREPSSETPQMRHRADHARAESNRRDVCSQPHKEQEPERAPTHVSDLDASRTVTVTRTSLPLPSLPSSPSPTRHSPWLSPSSPSTSTILRRKARLLLRHASLATDRTCRPHQAVSLNIHLPRQGPRRWLRRHRPRRRG